MIAVGRLVAAKGQRDLVEAVARLTPAVRDGLEVDLIGASDASDPDYISGLGERIEELGLGDVVRLELDLPDDALRQRYLDAAVFVSTSRHEGFCVPVVEALGSGCRVVTTDAGALPETVGPCGTVVPVGDVGALADAVAVALDGGERDEQQLQRCTDHLARFTPDAFAERTLAAVDRLLAATGPAPR